MSFTLRSIQCSKFGVGTNDVQSDTICGVWSSEGKIYISTNESKRLIVTDIVPRSRWTERLDTVIENSPANVIAVFSNPRQSSQIYVVYNNSITDCVELDTSTNKWTKKYSFQLSNAKGAEILSISFHTHTSMFFWCEKRGTSLGLTSCCVCMREVPENWDENFVTYIGPIVAILQCCPMMSLYIVNKGVCMLPHLPGDEKKLLFFWTFFPRSLKVYAWNHTTIDTSNKTDFRSIIMHLLPVWNSYLSNEHIISLTTHPTTLELLILDSTFTISYAYVKDGEVSFDQLSKLIINQDIRKQIVKTVFAFGVFVGLVFQSGHLCIFDSRSGVSLYTMTELEGHNLSVWTGALHSVVVWTVGSIWELKSNSITEVARVMQNSVQLNCKNHEEDHGDIDQSHPQEEKQSRKDLITCGTCFPGYPCHSIDQLPGNYIPSNVGPLAATQFLQAWNMLPVAAKVALNSVVLKMISNDTENFQDIEKGHLEILLGKDFQSPVAAIALFYDHPSYKEQVLLNVNSFLKNYEQEEIDSSETASKTTLNKILYSYIKQFITLTEKFNDVVTAPKFDLESDVVSGNVEVQQILRKLNLANPDSQSMFRLTYLQSQSPKEVFESMAVIMELVREKDKSTHQEVKNNSRRWRKIFRLEWKDGRWRRNRAATESTSNPSLGLLCNLLYNQEPDWLLRVYENGVQLVSPKNTDERAKDHVTQSILDSLPALIVEPSPKAVYAHAFLLWTAGQEMQAMQVILRHQMWEEALDFFSSLDEDTNSFVAIFTMLLKELLRCMAPKEVLLKALSLVPKEFSAYELLLLFQDNGPRCSQPFVSNDQVLTIGDIRENLKDLLIH